MDPITIGLGSNILQGLVALRSLLEKKGKNGGNKINFENCNIIVSLPSNSNNSNCTMLLCDNSPRFDTHQETSPNAHQTDSPTFVLDAFSNKSNKSSNSDIQEEASILPFMTGIYLRFIDPKDFAPKWWDSCPSQIDIIPNVRMVPILGQSSCFASLESEERKIQVTITPGLFLVKQSRRTMKFPLPLHPQKPNRTDCSESSSWSLRYIPPSRLTKLNFNANHIIVQYHNHHVSKMWWLVNHHKSRGDAAYLLLQKGNLGDKQ